MRTRCNIRPRKLNAMAMGLEPCSSRWAQSYQRRPTGWTSSDDHCPPSVLCGPTPRVKDRCCKKLPPKKMTLRVATYRAQSVAPLRRTRSAPQQHPVGRNISVNAALRSVDVIRCAWLAGQPASQPASPLVPVVRRAALAASWLSPSQVSSIKLATKLAPSECPIVPLGTPYTRRFLHVGLSVLGVMARVKKWVS